MHHATKGGCITDTCKLLRHGLADRANEGALAPPWAIRLLPFSLGGVRRRRWYSTANASLAAFGILDTPATPAPRLTIGIARRRWPPNPSFVK